MSNAEEIQELKNRILAKHKAGKITSDELRMTRVPMPAIKIFKEFAFKEFCGDYGMAFRDLVEKKLVLEPYLNSIIAMIQELDERLSKLEGNVQTKSTKPKIKTIKTCGGKRIELPLKEE